MGEEEELAQLDGFAPDGGAPSQDVTEDEEPADEEEGEDLLDNMHKCGPGSGACEGLCRHMHRRSPAASWAGPRGSPLCTPPTPNRCSRPRPRPPRARARPPAATTARSARWTATRRRAWTRSTRSR